MNKKIYISLPIAIDEKTVKERYNNAVDFIKNHQDIYSEYEISGPVNISDFGDYGLSVPREHDYAWYMGEDIRELLRCDAIFMTSGWEESKGCTAEYEIAKVYNKKIFSINSIL